MRQKQILIIVALVVVAGAVYFLRPTGPATPAGISPAELAERGPAGAAKGFNLLFISVDTLRADHVGCYGYEGARTPRMDGLAEHGIRFEHAIASAPITLPSHSTMMTGLYVPTHGVRHNGTFVLEEEQNTLAEVLSAENYQTGAFVAAYVLDRRYGLAQGFETYDDNVNPTGQALGFVGYHQRTANHVSDSAIAWLEQVSQDSSRPFFGWIHYFDPHAPYRPPPSFAADFKGRLYDGEIAYTDTEIARVLDFLDSRGLTERTLVVLTSDHGEGLGEHGEATHTLLIYDATVRVPLIISCPTLFPVGATYSAGAVSHADLFPSLLHLLGVKADQPVDGVNLFAAPPDEKRAVYTESMGPLFEHGWSSLHGLRRVGDKYIQAPAREYYDIASDPGELRNLYPRAAATELSRDLEQRMAGWGSPLESLNAASPLDPEQLERLQAVGYFRGSRGSEGIGVADPKKMMPIYQRIEVAEALCTAEKHEQAIAEIRKVLQEAPESAKAWYAAVRIYNRSNNPDRAYAAIKEALDRQPRSDGFVSLATMELQRQNEEGFRSAIAAAQALDPNDGGIYIVLGDRHALSRDYQGAIKWFQKAIEVDPHRSGPRARDKIQKAQQRLGQ